MSHPMPFYREAGAGPGVVCLHSNASTSSQWRGLMECLSGRFRVLAPDSLGAGKSLDWPQGRVVSLADEVALLEPVFALAGDPFFLVGHSYGAAVALVAALAHPGRVRALALYEPTLFSLLEEEAPGSEAAKGIRDAAHDAAAAIDAADHAGAARHFLDYWMGPGSWDGMPAARQGPVAASMANVRGWAAALFGQPTPVQAFRALDMPVLYMVGGQSPASARGVARLLTRVLPRVTVRKFADLGHMGPVTHPDTVNEEIARFFARCV
ncbi:MAG: alpha/beta hydrolase [Polaromonas sp.]|nr:alpha/beta hydrolase [Polaromonas sp.]